MTLFKRPLFLLPVLLIPAVAFAQDVSDMGNDFLMHPDLDPIAFVSSIVYGLLGIALAMFGYKVYAWMVPFDLNKEIEIDQNPAVGMVLGSVIIGVSIIVAASIH
jgi:hypothetical protein